MALYIPQSILHLARSLYVRPETYGPNYVQTLRNRVLHDNQRVIIYSSNSLHCMEPMGSLLFSQKLKTSTYHEPQKLVHAIPTYVFNLYPTAFKLFFMLPVRSFSRDSPLTAL